KNDFASTLKVHGDDLSCNPIGEPQPIAMPSWRFDEGEARHQGFYLRHVYSFPAAGLRSAEESRGLRRSDRTRMYASQVPASKSRVLLCCQAGKSPLHFPLYAYARVCSIVKASREADESRFHPHPQPPGTAGSTR